MNKEDELLEQEMETTKSGFKDIKVNWKIIKDIPFVNDVLGNKIKNVYKEFEVNIRKYLIASHSKNDTPMINLSEHDMLFRKFYLNPVNEQNKENYISFCTNNNIFLNEKTLENIEYFYLFKRNLKDTVKRYEDISKILNEKLGLSNYQKESNVEQIEQLDNTNSKLNKHFQN